MTLVDQCVKRVLLFSSIARPRAISPTPASRQGRWFPLVDGNSVSSYADWLAACFDDHLNSLPSIHIRCRITASFRAMATLALRSPLRFASRMPQALSADQLCYTGEQHISCLVVITSQQLIPHFEIRPVQSTSPDANRLVVSPT